MKLKFVLPNDPILNKVASLVSSDKITSEKIQQIIKKMYAVALPEQGDAAKPILVGLAAPQVGISKRIILVDVGADGKGKVSDLRVYINPIIKWKSKEVLEWYEGCYSASRVCGIVSRSKSIILKAYDQLGQEIEEKFEGYRARIFQHEIDHLDGIEFVRHIESDKNLHWVKEDEFSAYRNNEGWRNWPKKCPRARWAKIKGLVG